MSKWIKRSTFAWTVLLIQDFNHNQNGLQNSMLSMESKTLEKDKTLLLHCHLYYVNLSIIYADQNKWTISDKPFSLKFPSSLLCLQKDKYIFLKFTLEQENCQSLECDYILKISGKNICNISSHYNITR